MVGDIEEHWPIHSCLGIVKTESCLSNFLVFTKWSGIMPADI